MSNNLTLTGVSTLKTTYDFTSVPGQLTITLTDMAGPTVVGTIVLETEKHRALMEALSGNAESFDAPNDPILLKRRTLLDLNQATATTVFS
jgi:hypothetical protein